MALDLDLDPRFLLARPDLAEQALEGLVRADRFAPTRERRCGQSFAPITDASGAALGELIFGEAFDVLEAVGGRLWGRARRDGTVGFVEPELLTAPKGAPTHRVAGGDAALPLNALVGPDDPVEARDRADFRTFDPDPATAAERLLGAPWRAGGRTRAGIDRAGLVQQALFACGRPGPRQSDLQAQLGKPAETPRRGDLAVWVGAHAGVLVAEDRIIHACPDAGAVRVDPLADIDARWRGRGAAEPVFRRV